MLRYDNNLQRVHVLGVDPGLNNTGLANIVYNKTDRRIEEIETFVIATEKLADISGMDDEDYGAFMRKLQSLNHYWQAHLRGFRPEQIISESPFFNRLRPSSYEYLVAVMTTLRTGCFAVDPNIRFATLAPLEIKKWLGMAGKKGKDPVKEAFLLKAEVLAVLKNPVETMCEHEIDAASAGCAWLYTNGHIGGA